MKKPILVSLILILCLCVGVQLNAQSANITANSSAEIVVPLTIIDNSGIAGGTNLNFGRMTISPTVAGTVVLTAQNARTTTGGVTAVPSTTSTASFGLTGRAGSTYQITLPGNINITREGGAETMMVNNFTSIPLSAGVQQLTGTLIGGTDSFTVGGTLNVAAAQAVGVYVGTFTVTVAYN